MVRPSKHQILVVDDEQSIRESMALLLTSAGYDVVTAHDGLAALSQLNRMLPDLIVSDLNMPQMSGYELLSVVRKRFPQITILAMSGAFQENGVPSGVLADGFFAKGQNPKNLLAKIDALIRTSQTWVVANRSDDAPEPWISPPGKDLRPASKPSYGATAQQGND